MEPVSWFSNPDEVSDPHSRCPVFSGTSGELVTNRAPGSTSALCQKRQHDVDTSERAQLDGIDSRVRLPELRILSA